MNLSNLIPQALRGKQADPQADVAACKEALAKAERAFAASETDKNYAALQDARVRLDKAETKARVAAEKQAEAAAKVRKAKLAELRALVQSATNWQSDLDADAARCAEMFRELNAIMDRLRSRVLRQNDEVRQAQRLADELGETISLPIFARFENGIGHIQRANGRVARQCENSLTLVELIRAELPR